MTTEKNVTDYLELFELTWQDDKALVLLTELLAAYRREKTRADEWQGMYEVAAGRAKKLNDAIIATLDENSHLADGDNCTLKALKDAVGIG